MAVGPTRVLALLREGTLSGSFKYPTPNQVAWLPVRAQEMFAVRIAERWHQAKCFTQQVTSNPSNRLGKQAIVRKLRRREVKWFAQVKVTLPDCKPRSSDSKARIPAAAPQQVSSDGNVLPGVTHT